MTVNVFYRDNPMPTGPHQPIPQTYELWLAAPTPAHEPIYVRAFNDADQRDEYVVANDWVLMTE